MSRLNRVEQKAQTRKKIIDAAIAVFGRLGILAARTDDVAGEAGVSHGSVFAHFATQEALICAAIWEFGQTTAVRTHELAGGQKGVRGVLAAYLQGIGETEDFYARLAAEAPLLPKECRHALLMVQSALSLHLAEAAERDAKKGLVKELPAHMLFNTWTGLVQYYIVNRDLFAPGGSVIARRGEEMLDCFMLMIAKG